MPSADNPSRDRDSYRNVRGPALQHILSDRKRERRRQALLDGPIVSDSRGLWFRRGPLAVDVRIDRPGVAVIRLIGDVDPLTRPVIRRAVLKQVQGAPRRMIIDLRHLTFFGSAGVSELLAVWQIGQGHKFNVALVASPGSVLRTLEVCGLADLFDVHPTLENALSDP